MNKILAKEEKMVLADQKANQECRHLQGRIDEKIDDLESQLKNLNEVRIEENKDVNETLLRL